MFEQGTREYEWYDWNSLLAFEPENRAVMPALMDGSSEFPSRPEMETGIRTFAERDGRAHPPRHPLGGHRAGRRALRAAYLGRRLPGRCS